MNPVELLTVKPFCSQKQLDFFKAIRARELAARLRDAGAAITTGDTIPSKSTTSSAKPAKP